MFSTSSVGRSLCDIVRPFWIPMETKKKKSTCLLEMLSLTPCSRAKIVRKKKNPRRGTRRCRIKIPNTNNANKQRIKRARTNLKSSSLPLFFLIYSLTRVVFFVHNADRQTFRTFFFLFFPVAITLGIKLCSV